MKISVAVCTYNGEKFIGQQLESILKQTLKVDEIIICDDASTDNTLKIIEEASRNNPGLISVHKSNENSGVIKNFEKSISLTTGDFVFLSDQDDIWRSDKTDKIIRKFKEQPKAFLVFSNGELIDQYGMKTGSTLWDKWGFTDNMRSKWKNNKFAFEDLLINRNRVTGATVAFKKKLKDYSIPIQVPQGYWHDAFLSLNASALNGLYYIEECLIDYRIHRGQQIGLPDSFRKNFNNNNFSGSISYFRFLFKIIKRFKSCTLRIITIRVLIKTLRSSLKN
jgi:glycosyltransferase involved in cell wall biosynthesis